MAILAMKESIVLQCLLRYNRVMFIVGLLSWWYGAGWRRCAVSVGDGLLNIYDYFSIDLLIKTLFSPFRQISAGQVNGPLGVQFRAMLDKLISRVIGAIMRSVVIVIGSVALLLSVLLGLARIILWPLVPLVPVVAVVLAMSGWVPWTI